MEIRNFATFKKVVELGSFTRAAECLGYAQSTVTAHIQAIEEGLGCHLFDRIGKKVILTQQGEKLLSYATELLATYEKIQYLSAGEDIPKGIVKIGAPESLTTYRLAAVLQGYKKKYPQVDLVLTNSICWKLREDLHKGDLDIAFTLEPEVKDPDFIVEKLQEERMVFIFPGDLSCSRELSISQNQTVIYSEKGCSYRNIFEKHLQDNGITPGNFLETWSVETIKQCVACGIGTSFLPLYTVEKEIKEGRISAVEWKHQSGQGVITQMIYHKNKWISPGVEAFLQLVREHSKNWLCSY